MGGYAYAADNPVTDSDPTGQIAVGPPGSDCSTGTEYLAQCGGTDTGSTGSTDTGDGDGTATSTSTAPATPSGVYGCSKFDCAYAASAWAQMGSTPGGWKSLVAGVGSFFVGLGDSGICAQPLACLGYQSIGGEMPSALYVNWLNSHGVDTSPNSTYFDGLALVSILTLAIGGAAADVPGVSADTGDGINLADRATEVQSSLPPRTARSTTTAVLRAITPSGNSQILVATSEQYFRTHGSTPST